MGDRHARLTIADLRAGRNNVDPPQALAANHCVEALNVDWYNSPFGRKRGGVVPVTPSNSPFTGTFSSLARHVPTTDLTVAELWGTDDAVTPHVGRLTGTVWTAPTLIDAPTGNGWDFSYASLNGKLFIAYQSAVDRLHVWDPVTAKVRRTGLAVMGTPTAANTGAGTYAAILRYYRTRVTEQRSSVTVRRSEASASVSFTPSGSGTGVVVTQGTLPGEIETHWEVEASVDNVTFYRIATVVIATTTYTDSAATTSYATNPVSAVAGTYGLQKSYKYLAADNARLLGFGAYLSTNPQNRVEYSAVLGSSDIGDDERVPLNNYQGLNENDGGTATALKGPVNGSFFAGKDRQFWKLTPTGDVNTPYNPLRLSPVVGPLGPNAMGIGEDESGNAAVYFNSFRGPHRWGANGIEYLGKPIEDLTIGANGGSSLNLAATQVVSHLVWYPNKRQVWIWIATGANNDPDTVCCLTIGRTPLFYGGSSVIDRVPSGWSRFTGGVATARCSTLFSTTIGASMSRNIQPYIGSTSAVNTLGICDSGTQDLGVSYQAYVDTAVVQPWDNKSGTIMDAQIIAKAAAATTVQLTVTGDFGTQSRAASLSLAATGAETRVQPRVGGGIALSGLQAVQFRLGDSAPANTAWTMDSLTVTHQSEGPVAA